MTKIQYTNVLNYIYKEYKFKVNFLHIDGSEFNWKKNIMKKIM